MTERLHVHANLVLASRFQLQLHERIAVGPLDGAVVRDGELASVVYRRGADVQLAVGEPGAYGALVFLHVAHDDGHVTAVVHDVVPVVAERVLRLLILGIHHDARGFAVQTVHHEDAVVAVRALHVLIQNVLCGAFLLVVGSHGQQSFLLLHHDEIGILVENLQHGVAELVLVLFTAHLHLHARLQGKVVLRLDVVVHQHHAVGQQGFYARAADAVHLLHKELHQFRRFIDRIDCIFGCGTRDRASAVVARVISCHFVASVKS